MTGGQFCITSPQKTRALVRGSSFELLVVSGDEQEQGVVALDLRHVLPVSTLLLGAERTNGGDEGGTDDAHGGPFDTGGVLIISPVNYAKKLEALLGASSF